MQKEDVANNSCPGTFIIYLDTRDNAIIEDDEKHQNDGDTAGDGDDDDRDIHQLLLS